jgi:hypothetical protein
MKIPSKYFKDIIAYGFMILLVSIVIVILSWIVFKIGNSIFSLLNTNFHFELVDILIGMVVITLILLLTSSDTSNYKSLSKTGQNEEDWRWIRDYVGDDY